MTGMQTIQALLTTMTIAITVFASAVVVLRASTRRDQIVFLVTALVLHGLIAAGELFILTEAYQFAPGLAGAHLPLIILLGPAVYFYTRSMTSMTQPRWLSLADSKALLGPIFILVIMLPFISLSSEEKLSLASQETRDPEVFANIVLVCAASFSGFIVFLYLYLFASLHLVTKHKREIQKHFSNLEKRSLNWIFGMLLTLAIGWSWYSIGYIWSFIDVRPQWVSVTTSLSQLAVASVFALLGVLQPSILVSAPRGIEKSYANSALTKTDMARIAKKLTAVMRDEQLFTNNTLSLKMLSEYTDVSENYLSETLNQFLHTNFFKFVNTLRVEKACELLAQTDDSVLDITYTVGFNSRSTFNTSFKKLTGQTPREYRNHTRKLSPTT